MESYVAPARTLTPDQREAIQYFYKARWGVATFLSLFMPVMLSLPIGAANHDLLPWVGVGVAVGGAINGLRYWNARRKMRRATFIYEYGQPETVVFTGLGANYGIKVNGQPQPVINLLRGNEPLKIKTFDDRILTAFMLPQQTVYTHPNYPDVLVPSSLFALDRSARQQPKPRTVGV